MTGVTARAAIALILVATTLGGLAEAQLPARVGGQDVPTLAPLVKQVEPAVVSIATKGTISAPANPLMEDPFFRRFFGFPDQQQQQRRQRQVQSAGSGVIVDAAKGYILTNHHVVENAEEIEVVLSDNRNLKAKVVGSDAGTDIAVLQVDNGKSLVQMKLGNSDQVEVGDFVLAIGNPFGLQHTVTSGIVSALGRSGINPDGYEDFIQTDASINPGNSGGALVNLKGELIGINSAIFSNSGGNIGIGFAIPVNIAKSIMNQILKFGEVKRGLLGVSISDFNAESAKAYGVEATVEGALVQEVVVGSAAEKAGIEVGDVIVSVDGQRIKSASDLRNNVGLKRSGDSVRVEVIRDGKQAKFTAILSELSIAARISGEEIHPGLAGAELGNHEGKADQFAGPGVLLESVEPESPAALAGLQTNDIIVSVNRIRVRNVRELQQAAGQQPLLLISIRRGNRNLLLQIR
ncbi:MAG: Do family serine endopeptidase [Gammaproteobacteria bacterium]|nr:Do family serine endopeptidase [Gammaproteobacteria bacterium]MDH5275292.1 Do family serine endopeptidase [Gammaproteobacteria bacterium]